MTDYAFLDAIGQKIIVRTPTIDDPRAVAVRFAGAEALGGGLMGFIRANADAAIVANTKDTHEKYTIHPCGKLEARSVEEFRLDRFIRKHRSRPEVDYPNSIEALREAARQFESGNIEAGVGCLMMARDFIPARSTEFNRADALVGAAMFLIRDDLAQLAQLARKLADLLEGVTA